MTTNKDSSISRRSMLRKTASGAAVAVAAPTVILSSAMGFAGYTAPSERITFGMIGLGQMMKGHFRNMLDRGNVPISLDTIRSGKDVYVEKPMSLTIPEGRAVRRHGAIVEIRRRSIKPAKAVDILIAQIGGAPARSQANILQSLV